MSHRREQHGFCRIKQPANTYLPQNLLFSDDCHLIKLPLATLKRVTVHKDMAKKAKQRRPKHTPQRTCIACRQKFDKREIIRIVRTPEQTILVDITGKQNGRGAYVCYQSTCWQKLLQTPILAQALKTTIDQTQKEAVIQALTQQFSLE